MRLLSIVTLSIIVYNTEAADGHSNSYFLISSANIGAFKNPN